MRRVVGAGTEPHEPWLRRVCRLLIAQHTESLIGKILRQVISLLGCRRWIDESVVFHEVGIPVVGLAAEEAVETIEPFLQRPFRPAGAACNVLYRNVVFLAQPECAVTVVLKHLPNGGAFG